MSHLLTSFTRNDIWWLLTCDIVVIETVTDGSLRGHGYVEGHCTLTLSIEMIREMIKHGYLTSLYIEDTEELIMQSALGTIGEAQLEMIPSAKAFTLYPNDAFTAHERTNCKQIRKGEWKVDRVW